MFESVPETEWRKLHGAISAATRIHHNAARVIHGLHQVFSSPDLKVELGFEVEQNSQTGLGIIRTPFYDGRFRLDWAVLGQLSGRLVAERRVPDGEDRLVWQTAYSMTIPSHGVARIGEAENSMSVDFDKDEDDWRRNYGDPLFALGMSILYAFANDPRAQ